MHELLLSRSLLTESPADSSEHSVRVHAERASETVERHWLAQLSLEFESRRNATQLIRAAHQGPLRVQKPFYPEDNGTCHVYVLHPPGGMAIGDALEIKAELKPGTHVLMTTPSAGKLYGVKKCADIQSDVQTQLVKLNIAGNACLEWLPQETIVFDSAQGKIQTRVNTTIDALFFVWDIVRLGRAASGEKFTQGHCHQSLEIWQDHKPLFIERNTFNAGSEWSRAKWGLQSANTSATLVASLHAPREHLENWLAYLQKNFNEESGLWGLTQKKQLFIARYLGNSVSQCRKGFEYLWQQSRPLLNNTKAVTPRIWLT